MAVEYTLLMQKMADGSAMKSSLDDFGFVVCDIPWPDVETKKLKSRDWPGEDGEDVYIPSVLNVAAYDIEITLIYKGDRCSCKRNYSALRDYLLGRDGGGAALIIYDPYNGFGRQGVYLLKITNPQYFHDNINDILEVTLTLRVTDPLTDITLSV